MNITVAYSILLRENTHSVRGIIKELLLRRYLKASAKEYFFGKNGLEIGGPSKIFFPQSFLPVYSIAESLDNCNFAPTTVWEGDVQQGNTFNYYSSKRGTQYICEATELRAILKKEYDFVISSHVLEHIANPIEALKNFRDALKTSGIMLLVVPDKRGGFDHNRPTTSLDHIIGDFQKKTREDDLTHLPEILNLHDLKFDRAAGSIDNLRVRSKINYKNRCLHHHTFNQEVVTRMIEYVGGLKIVFACTSASYNIIILAVKIR
jgi:SAM-dependent methyltransferase